MPIKVEFHFDFGSPNSYYCHQVIPAIEKRIGVKFEYVPILLGGVFSVSVRGHVTPSGGEVEGGFLPT